MSTPSLASRIASASADLLRLPQAALPADAALGPMQQLVAEAGASGQSDAAIPALEALTARWPAHPGLWRLLGFAARNDQRMATAHHAFAQAAQAAPEDPDHATALAQIAFERGHLAAGLFARAAALAPGSLTIARSHCAALAAESDVAGAEAMLDALLAQNPGWLDGHRLLANLRSTMAGSSDYARSFAAACATLPKDKALRLAWFHTIVQARDWQQASAILDAGEKLLGEQPGFTMGRLLVASESGARANDAQLFAPVADLRDPGLDLCQIRHALRLGDAQMAQALALRNLGGPAARNFWPYLSLAWRLLDDPRAAWLDGDPHYIRSFDLPLTTEELAILADVLRGLHKARAPYRDQSVRGGTQTDRPLLLRDDPAIQHIRGKISDAVLHYAATLPPPDPAHPLLAARRDKCLFAGSWSVRLASQGYHAVHSHPAGWISSALYVALPDAAAMGDAPAGWLSFGTPPPELGLSLSPYRSVEPKPGRLVLFPSTLWHGTEPFTAGERLTIAFDVQGLPPV